MKHIIFAILFGSPLVALAAGNVNATKLPCRHYLVGLATPYQQDPYTPEDGYEDGYQNTDEAEHYEDEMDPVDETRDGDSGDARDPGDF